MANEENLPRPQLLESKRLAKGLLGFLARNPDRVSELYDLLDIFCVCTRIDFDFLRRFMGVTVAQCFSLTERRQACPNTPLQHFSGLCLPKGMFCFKNQSPSH